MNATYQTMLNCTIPALPIAISLIGAFLSTVN